MHAERQRRRDADRAAEGGVFGRNGEFGFFQVGENAPAAFVEAATALGQRDAARGTPQQLYAEPAFEFRKAPADSGFCDVHALRGGAEAAGFDHIDEGLDLAEFIHCSVFRNSNFSIMSFIL